MNHWSRVRFLLLLAALAALIAAPEANAQKVKDSVFVIEQITGQPYQCCFGFIVKSRQRKPQSIDEFAVRLLDSRARFLPGQSSSPPNWTVFQSVDSVRWLAATNAAELDSGETAQTFNVCAADTGVTRLVWETRHLGVLVSTDTIVVVCRGTFCDEPFFNIIPSALTCAFNIDLVAGNGEDRIVNDFHLQIVDSGFTFITSTGTSPTGWTRIKGTTDSMSWRTFNNGLEINEFVEGFRVHFNAKKDTSFRVEWWTTNFGEVLCRDTVRLVCGVSLLDSFQITDANVEGDTCCQDIRLKNTHYPKSTLNGLSIKVTTPKAKIKVPVQMPGGWTTMGVNATGDSIMFTATDGLVYNDTALFQGICFDNDSARTDLISYRLTTFGKGVPVATTNATQICERRQLNCDTIIAVVDSTFPASRRCIRMTVKNVNSRGDEIDRIVFRLENEGTKRVFVSAVRPPSTGWIATVTPDSVVFTESFMRSGESLAGFEVCVSMGDSTTRDPLNILWTTSNEQRPVCSGTFPVNAIIERVCDVVTTKEVPSPDEITCCFDVTVHNRNEFNRAIDRVLLSIPGSNIIFTGGAPAPGWTLTTEALPNFSLDFSGATIAPGDSATFTVCMNISLLGSTRPIALPPIAWTTFGGGQLTCLDTLRLVCRGVDQEPVVCDTVKVVPASRDDEQGICRYRMIAVNRHSISPGVINGVRLRITGGTGSFRDANPGIGSWSTVTATDTEILFRGSNIRTNDSLDTFTFGIDGSNGNPITIEATTYNGDTLVCTHTTETSCQPGTLGVDLVRTGEGVRLHDNRPNPFSATTEIGYELATSAQVTLIVRDQSGAEVRRIERGSEEAGEHRMMLDLSDLPSGVYYYTLKTGTATVTRSMLLVR